MATDVSAPTQFVDHYAVLDASPDLAFEEVKKLYHDKIREFHPDKRPDTPGSHGRDMTRALNAAFEVLRDPDKKEAYDASWRDEKERSLPAHERADIYRRRGNDLYGNARGRSRDGSNSMNMVAVHQSITLFKGAMEEYTKAMAFAPNDHRLYSNRALCFIAVEDWARARDDAQYCARLRPDFKKAWLLLTKALWKLGRFEEANAQLQQGLQYLPGCSELMELQADFGSAVGEASFRTASRSVSPAYTPSASRNATPPPPPPKGGTYSPGPSKRPVSPPLVAAGGLAAASRAAGMARTAGGPSSRSPGPSARSHGGPPNLEASGTMHTGNFGAPTPSFATGGPTNQAMYASFPAHASTMWAGSGPPTQRSSYSPGPGTARSGAPGPDIGPPGRSGSRNSSPGLRKSASLKGMLDASQRATPPRSRETTPPRR